MNTDAIRKALGATFSYKVPHASGGVIGAMQAVMEVNKQRAMRAHQDRERIPQDYPTGSMWCRRFWRMYR